MHFSSFVLGTAAAASCVSATQLNVKTASGTTSAAQAIASNLMSYSETGALPSPYNWWESAGMMSTMIGYWKTTGDSSHNNNIASAIAAQAGSTQDFMGPSTTGNDDQLWWGIAAMTAAEYNFQAPAGGSSWLQLAENVFNDVQARWDTSTCNGGLGWQISATAPGHDYKNAISNGLFFQLAARLARYTGNAKYSTWASEIFGWVQSVGLVDKSSYAVYDGTDASQGCKSLDHDEWSYNVGVFLYGAAVMLDYTDDTSAWQPHVDGFIKAAQAGFTQNGVLQETKCEPSGSCNTDQLSFKAYTTRWLVQTAALVPSTSAQITPLLQASVDSALMSCNGGPNQDTCGTRWPVNKYDGSTGAGQQMAALEVVQGQFAGDKFMPGKAAAAKTARNFQA